MQRNYLVWKFKVEGKPIVVNDKGMSKRAIGKMSIKDGDLTSDAKKGVEITSGSDSVTVASKSGVSKRYIKYLTKRYIAHIEMRDYLCVTASDKQSYIIKPRKGTEAEEEDEE